MPDTYYIGKRVWLLISTTDVDGVAVDIQPGDELSVTFAGAATGTLLLSLNEIEHAGTGLYYAPIVPDQAGTCNWRTEVTCVHLTNGIQDHLVTAEQGWFWVREQNVP